MPSELKVLMADELAGFYPAGSDYVVVGHTRLSGSETINLRKMLRDRGLRMRVVKNSLAARALEASGLAEGSRFLHGPCAFVVGDIEMPEMCRIVTECAREFEEKFVVRGGMMDGMALMPEAISRLASIPPLPVLHAQIAGGILAPIAGVAAAFQSLLRSVACALEGIRKQKEGKAPPLAPETA